MNSCVDLLSPPAWWCGLKLNYIDACRQEYKVTTCVVVWIEIVDSTGSQRCTSVTTCVVVWIEINASRFTAWIVPGHHLRGGVD